ncbi:hypothetical protein [Dysgonomonas sp. ZJ279]|uniref:hypothetical protein n=1 Tax=Dysgonomonas sp. ZJ279 TaxID=2709796 RepID=UPI0013E9FE33|nr:hypothetical protein [Dysgonomonas sp. ZJ279]
MKRRNFFLLLLIPLFIGVFAACSDDDGLSDTSEAKHLPSKITIKFVNEFSSDLVESYTYDVYNRIVKQDVLVTPKDVEYGTLYRNMFDYDKDQIESKIISVTSYKENDPKATYKTNYSYGNNSLVYIKKEGGDIVATMQVNEAGYIQKHTTSSSIGFGEDITSYLYDEKGNISELVIETIGQNAKAASYNYIYDEKVGIFKYVRIPQWFLFTYGDMYATTFNPFVNNGLKITMEDETNLIYEAVYEYDNYGYPVVIEVYQLTSGSEERVLYETITIDYILAQ